MHLGDRLKLNYADWNVDNKNMIVYNPQGINVSQFNISGEEKAFLLTAVLPQPMHLLMLK
jgi:hypothetical protein